MNFYNITFILLSFVAIFTALMVVTRANPVASVMWLVLNFFCIAGFYVLLGAQFLAAVQIIVYAGAIMVLFLFVLMMLNLNLIGKLERSNIVLRAVGGLVAGLILVLLSFAVRTTSVAVTEGVTETTQMSLGTAKELGSWLFQRWVLPFQIVGVMLLAAIVGAVALSKREPTSSKTMFVKKMVVGSKPQ
ncbi:MAG: NADH-quinone oxidoreductase subunit J [bacterium]|nr:NADH-quinone oxidoreductase subunit J [bacterium]